MADSNQPGDWLGGIVERSGRLLRATLDASPTGGLAALALTFDVGTVTLRSAGGELVIDAHPAGKGEAGTNADEEDPWWTVLGDPLHRVHEHEAGLLLQFRDDSSSPKILLLSADGAAVRVRTIV